MCIIIYYCIFEGIQAYVATVYLYIIFIMAFSSSIGTRYTSYIMYTASTQMTDWIYNRAISHVRLGTRLRLRTITIYSYKKIEQKKKSYVWCVMCETFGDRISNISRSKKVFFFFLNIILYILNFIISQLLRTEKRFGCRLRTPRC